MDKDIAPLNVLVGRQLSSVEFVRDYLQLRFEGPCLTVITDPIVEMGSIKFERNNNEFCNVLCGRISTTVLQAYVHENEEIRIDFHDNAGIIISLKPENYIGPEAALFQNDAGELWVW